MCQSSPCVSIFSWRSNTCQHLKFRQTESRHLENFDANRKNSILQRKGKESIFVLFIFNIWIILMSAKMINR